MSIIKFPETEAIMIYLATQGYWCGYTPKKWNVKTARKHGKYSGYVRVVKTLEEAKQFILNDKKPRE